MKLAFQIILPGLLSLSAAAQDVRWTGALSEFWDNSRNWARATPPNSDGDVVFPANALRKACQNNLPAGTALSKLVFDAGGYVIEGNPLRIKSGGIILADGTAAERVVSLRLPLTLGASQTFSIGGLSGSADGLLLHLKGAVSMGDFPLQIEGGDAVLDAPVTANMRGGTALKFTGIGVKTISQGVTITAPRIEISGLAGHVRLLGEVVADTMLVTALLPQTPGKGGVLSGTGRVEADCRVLRYGVLSPGVEGFGRLRMDKNLVLGGDSLVEIELGNPSSAGKTHDQVRVQGAVEIQTGASLLIKPGAGFAPVAGQAYTVLEKTGAGPVTGRFQNLPQGATIRVGEATMLVSYTGGDGNDVTVTVVDLPPAISAIPAQTVHEDGRVTVAFTVSDPNTDLSALRVSLRGGQVTASFSGAGAARTATIRPQPDFFGQTTVTLEVSDATVSTRRSFELEVLPVNDTPSFTAAPVIEFVRGALQSRAAASNVSAGPGEEQALAFEVLSVSNPQLFRVLPALTPGGMLTCGPVETGESLVRVRLLDDGGNDHGGIHASPPQTILLRVGADKESPIAPPVDVTWTGLAGSQWNNGRNWSTLLVPQHAATAGFAADLPARRSKSVDISGGAQCGQLRFSGGGYRLHGGDGDFILAAEARLTAGVDTRFDALLKGRESLSLIAGQGARLELKGGLECPFRGFALPIPPVRPNKLFMNLGFGSVMEINGGRLADVDILMGGKGRIVMEGDVFHMGETNLFNGGFHVLEVNGSFGTRLTNVERDLNSVVFQSTATLRGTGTVLGRLSAGGLIQPGRTGGVEGDAAGQIGRLTVHIATVVDNGAENLGVLELDIGSAAGPGVTYDQLIVEKRLVLDNARLRLRPAQGFAPRVGDVFTLVNVAGPVTGARTGFFAGLPEGAALRVGNADLRVSYTGGDGNDITATVTALAAGASGFASASTLTNAAPFTPGSYCGLAVADQGVLPGHENAGLLSLTVTQTGTFSGKLLMGGASHKFSGAFKSDGSALFGKAGGLLTLPRKNLAPLVLSLRAGSSDGGPCVTALILEDGRPFASARADRALYDSVKSPAPAWMTDAKSGKGKFTAAFPALAAPNRGLEAASFPQGDGWALMSLARDGRVTMTGQLADGAQITLSGLITTGGSLSIHVPLYSGKGSLSGMARFEQQPLTDAAGVDFFWFRPAQTPRAAAPYAAGWPQGIHVDFDACRLVEKAAPYLAGLAAPGPAGNVLITVDGLAQKAASLEPANKIVLVNRPDPDKLASAITTSSGKWSGSFIHPADMKKKAFSGVVLQKSGRCAAFYLAPQGSGLAGFSVVP